VLTTAGILGGSSLRNVPRAAVRRTRGDCVRGHRIRSSEAPHDSLDAGATVCGRSSRGRAGALRVHFRSPERERPDILRGSGAPGQTCSGGTP
jgi:hypothetical protein